jgi:hypothetical protein
MSDANVSVLLAEEKAFWMDSSHLGLLPDESIVREWRNLNVQTRTECIAHLKSRTTVTNPKAQTKAYAGVYRVLKIEDIVERNKQGGTDSLTIRETLADGYDATLVGKFPRLAEEADVVGSGTTEAANIAHPGGTAAVQEDWRTITIRWKDLNHDSLEAIRAERTAVTAATLTVGTEAKTGPWFLISRKPSWEDDGTGVYEETWSLDEWHMESKGKTANTKVIVNRYVQNVPKDRVKTVLDAEIAACTGYGTQGYTYEQKLYWRDLYADIITEVTQAVKIEIAAFTAELDDSKTVSEKSGENLYDADIAAYETTTAAQGHTIRTQKSRNSDGTINATKIDETSIAQKIVSFVSKIAAFFKHEEIKGNNLYDADMSPDYVQTTQTTGKIITIEKDKNKDGTYRASKLTDTAIEVTASEATKSVDTFLTEEISKARNLGTEPTLPSDTQDEGIVRTLRKIFNDYKLWDSETTTETAHAKLSNGSYVTRYGTVYWWSARNYTLTAWNSLVGGITLDGTTDNHAQFEYNKFKLVDGTIVKRPVRETGSVPGWTIGKIASTQMDSERIYKQARNGKWKWKIITYYTDIWQDSSLTIAHARITGSGILATSPAGGSRVVNLSNGQYLTFVITSDEAESTWNDDASLS